MKKIIVLLIGILSIASIKNVLANGFGLGNTGDNKIPTVGNEIEDLMDRHNAFYIGDTNSKNIYLTFDTGYELGNTTKILDTLKKTNIKAAFFVTGHFLEENSDLVLRMHNEGHIVANHTWNHPDITKLSKEQLKIELDKVEEKYKEITNDEMSKFLRPPMGMINDESLNHTDELGYNVVYWSLAFVDWNVDSQKGWKYSYDNIMNRVHNGSILLLHTVSTDNTEALEKVIIDLEEKGYNFKTLNDLVITPY